ncbi:bifunctional adenosylcobinamide kinase/adenosylcobinamide-phosphate guanylyltransferase [Ferrimonas balearica]|uniref:bifunctional adenosylcobinamide kinase/adenosylcobinamide-phosphate guanylyltransferase n=1 Tax=Ferrimonas balearica TaxID=44012 RepID=UPI002D7EBF30|nr:bifunctional adenosylcobinamide kinase/adenosylcobinamide-phosphate guanylyltransferase [Ferrimonas balearica]MBY6096795.1 bifunctional adenosylcobinamide kinase/adenosylcobinamide-phosphate guanylyltransferase [Ferrimonas balearica]
MKHLIIGGARSGKSRLAQHLASLWQQQTGGEVVVIATAEYQPGQGSMAARIAHHKAHRPANWRTVEAPRQLASTLRRESDTQRLLVVDCLTLWLANEMACGHWPEPKSALLNALPTLPGPVLLIGNEVGQGIVPLGEQNRRFVDEAGWLHQHLADRVEQVTLVVAGLPLTLKGAGHDTP